MGRDLWIERDDYAEAPPKGWKRLSPGAEVRLRHGPVVRCTGIDRDDDGEIIGVRAFADLATINAEAEGRRVGVIHWADAETAQPATFRLVDRLFSVPVPEDADDITDVLNPDSLVETTGWTEPNLEPGTRYQFERLGYFWTDPADSSAEAPVWTRIVALRDSWGKKTGDGGRKAVGGAPATEKRASVAPVVAPRDYADGLSDAERVSFEALVARGVGPEEAAVIASDAELAELFEGVVIAGAEARETAVMLVQDVRPALDGASVSASKATPQALADALALAANGDVTNAAYRQVVAALVAQGGEARTTVERLGVGVVRDDAALVPAVEGAIANHPDKVAAYRGGADKLFGFFTGQAMRAAPRGADPEARPGAAPRAPGRVTVWVERGGVRSAVVLRGRGPVPVLLVHGGPGQSLLPFARAIGRTTRLEDAFALAYWEQRGTGLSRGRLDESDLSLDAIVRDAETVAQRLAERFGRAPVVVGHSWGTIIGAHLAARRPDLVAAYVGAAQVVNVCEQERRSTAWAVEQATARGDRGAARILDRLGPTPHSASGMMQQRSVLAHFGGVWHNHGATRLALSGLTDYLTTPEYGPRDLWRQARDPAFSLRALMADKLAVDLVRDVPRLDVPATFIVGVHDQIAPGALVDRYARALVAPRGAHVVRFEQSAHLPHIEEPARFEQVLRDAAGV